MRPLALLLLLLLVPRLATAEDTKVEVTLEPAVIGVHEMATLTFEARAEGLESPRFVPDFELENLDIVAGPYKSEDVRFINGAISRSFRFSLRVRPRGTGRARVHSITMALRGETFEMRDREITIQDEPTGPSEPEEEAGFEDPFERIFGGAFPSRRRPRDPQLFLRAEVTPERPYVGQQVLYTVHLYTRDDISSMMPRELPKFRGFWVRDIPLPPSDVPDMVDVNGARYARVTLVQRAIFPLRAGRHQIEPTEVDLIARVIEQRFFGPPLSRPEAVRLKTSLVNLDVRPLPPAPRGFGGTVGQIGLEARLEPSELRLGEAATLKLTLSGRGNLQGVPEPQLTAPAGLTLYPPQQESEDRTRGTTVAGERTWTYMVVPDKTGRHTLSVPEVSYFDPVSGAYRVASVPAVEIRTLPRLSVAGTGAPHPIRTAALAVPAGSLLGRIGSFPSTRWTPWLFALPWGLALVFLIARRGRPGSEGTGAPGTSGVASPAGDVVEQRLREAEAESRPRQAAARIEDAWRELLATRWDIPQSTPAARWGEALSTRGADPAAAEELARLAEDLHYLRYAPQLSETGDLVTEAVVRSRRLLRRLR